MTDIFLSYSTADRDRVRPLVDALMTRGWTVWWDPVVLPGERWDKVIRRNLEASRCVIVLWSEHSIESRFVPDEAEEGLQRGVLVPARLDDVRPPVGFGRIHWADLLDWPASLPHRGFDRLADAVGKIIGVAPEVVLKAESKAGDLWTNPKDGLNYVWIPPGKFIMGYSPGDSEAYDWEKPAHEVTITKGYWLGRTPVTVAAYNSYAKATSQELKEGGVDEPVVEVSWDEAVKYAEWAGMRLPTEAEWEYAARAGTTVSRYGELDKIAWYDKNSGNKIHVVGQKAPNAWGLYDMLGSVWEWVGDYWYGSYEAKAGIDPKGPATGTRRVLRGGSWYGNARYVRASSRGSSEPGSRYDYNGFRCAGELR